MDPFCEKEQKQQCIQRQVLEEVWDPVALSKLAHVTHDTELIGFTRNMRVVLLDVKQIPASATRLIEIT